MSHRFKTHLALPPPPHHHHSQQLKARVSELEAELEKLRYRADCLGRSLKEGHAAARRALEEVDKEGGDREGGKLRSRLGRILFGKYYYEGGEGEGAGQ